MMKKLKLKFITHVIKIVKVVLKEEIFMIINAQNVKKDINLI